MSLLPATYAGNSDFIMVPEETTVSEISLLPYFDVAAKKDIKIIRPSELAEIVGLFTKVSPWGWDHAVVRELLDAGCPSCLLPSPSRIADLRRLSHRRTTIPFRDLMAETLDETVIKPAKELFSSSEAENFLIKEPLVFFKAPWSSSGRGIVASNHISRKGLMEWIHGTIKKQGSVIAEPAWDKIFDFATEWNIGNGEVNFLGLSVFEASSRGKYHGNINASQKELQALISTHAPGFGKENIEAQRMAIETLIAPNYEGPLGIDMLSDKEGKINSCVEINLRMTMGAIMLHTTLLPDFRQGF